MTSAVLDASALLALFLREPGAGEVAAAVERGVCISAVNYSEVLKKTIERGGDAQRVLSAVQSLSIAIIPFDDAQAMVAASLFRHTREHGMSFADRACLALAQLRDLPAFTAERKMDQIGLAVRVHVIRHK